MKQDPPLIDYLAIGHVTKDITDDGYTLGGTVSYSGRTALSLGLKVGIITACSEGFDLSALNGIQIRKEASNHTTTFINKYTDRGRTQEISAVASYLAPNSVPDKWRQTEIIHLAPVANEVDEKLLNDFPSSFLGITPQGWLRTWDDSHQVCLSNWETIQHLLPKAHAVVLSFEDLRYDAGVERKMAKYCRLLAVTKAAQGATIYWNNECYDVPAPERNEMDSTGSGDIFASAFFIHFFQNQDPLQAGIFANQVASASITRKGINSTPTPNEIAVLGQVQS
jgi:sugar/nucleoside kinase (ribokinase family)